MSVYTGLNGFAGNLRRRNQSFDQTFRSHFHFHPHYTVSCWKVTFCVSEDGNSRSRLEAWDQREEILDLVSKHEIERKKFSISSRSMRLKGRNSRSRLEAWDWKEEILDLVSRVEIGISSCSGVGLFPKIILGILGKYFYSLPLIKLVGLDSTYLPPPHLPTNIAHSFPTQLEFTIYLHDIYWNKIFNVGLEYNGIKPRSNRKTTSEM